MAKVHVVLYSQNSFGCHALGNERSVKKKQNPTKYTFVETCFPSLILSFPSLPARETREKKASSVWLTAPGAGATLVFLRLCRHTLSLHPPSLPSPLPYPATGCCVGGKGLNGPSQVEVIWVGLDESDKCFFCLGLQWTHKCSRAAHDPGCVGTLARVGVECREWWGGKLVRGSGL